MANHAAMIAGKTLDDLGWPTLVDHWARRCATKRGEAVVRASQLFDSVPAARERAAEIAEARGLASRDARLPLGSISDVAGAIDRVRKSAALDAPELALFQVRFVPGAAPSCRRYVVSITKDGWLTTAPPMERCGPQPGPPRRQ